MPAAVTLGVRPHDVAIVPPGAGDVDARVDVVEPRGSELLVYARLGDEQRSGSAGRGAA